MSVNNGSYVNYKHKEQLRFKWRLDGRFTLCVYFNMLESATISCYVPDLYFQ